MIKHFEKNMKQMTISVGDSKGENYRQVVYVDELWWTDFHYKEKNIQEIVVASFYIKDTEIQKIKNNGNWFRLTELSWHSEESFIAHDFLDEYDINDAIKTKEGTRVILSRKTNHVINIEDEDDEEVKKIPKLSPSHPITFLQDEIMKECIYETYEKVRDSVTVPMVPNMRQPIILAGHVKVDIDIARKILDVLDGKGSHIIPKEKLELAQYFLNIYDLWVVEIVEGMKKAGYVKPINVYVTQSNAKPYHIIINHNFIRSMVSSYNRKGILWFTKNPEYDEVSDYNEFMLKMAPFITARIEAIAQPIHEYGDIRADTLEMMENAFIREFKDPQKNAIEACMKSLEKQGLASIIGEMGTGKTSMLFATAFMHAGLRMRKPMKLLVLSPNHLIKSTWQKEIKKISKNVEIHHIHTVSDLLEFEKKGYLTDNQKRSFVLSQSASKDGYQYRPAAIWSKARQHFSCPCCGEVFKRKKTEVDSLSGERYVVHVPVSFLHFSSNQPTQYNYKCKNCNEVIWEPINKNKSNGFIYSSALKGHVPRDIKAIERHVKELVRKKSDEKSKSARKDIEAKIQIFGKIRLALKGKVKEDKRRCNNEAPVAEFIFKKMKYKFTHLIIDELHEHQGNSKRGAAAGKLIHSVKNILCGTGTSMNGYADSRFKTDFMLQPHIMKKYGYDYNSQERFQVDFGVVENRYRWMEDNKGKLKRKSLGLRKRPGISPVFFTLFMQGINVFVSMEDFKDELPPMEYYHVPVEMDPDLAKAEKKLKSKVLSETRKDKKLRKSIWTLSYSFLDAPTKKKQIKNKDGEVIVETPTIDLHKDNKLQELKKLVHQEVYKENNRVIIYTHYSSDKINDYYHKHLTDEGFKVTVLNPTGEKTISCDGSFTDSKGIEGVDRELFIEKEVEKGCEVLIVNPRLIETGCNLTQFNTIIWAQMGFNLYTNRQADKRIYRLSTTKACKVIYLYYKETIQESVASLMASKIVASRSIEGHMDQSGLEELVSSRTAEEELAKIVYEGIKQSVKGIKTYKKAA